MTFRLWRCFCFRSVTSLSLLFHHKNWPGSFSLWATTVPFQSCTWRKMTGYTNISVLSQLFFILLSLLLSLSSSFSFLFHFSVCCFYVDVTMSQSDTTHSDPTKLRSYISFTIIIIIFTGHHRCHLCDRNADHDGDDLFGDCHSVAKILTAPVTPPPPPHPPTSFPSSSYLRCFHTVFVRNWFKCCSIGDHWHPSIKSIDRTDAAVECNICRFSHGFHLFQPQVIKFSMRQDIKCRFSIGKFSGSHHSFLLTSTLVLSLSFTRCKSINV